MDSVKLIEKGYVGEWACKMVTVWVQLLKSQWSYSCLMS